MKVQNKNDHSSNDDEKVGDDVKGHSDSPYRKQSSLQYASTSKTALYDSSGPTTR